jgi:hypothetical protein
VPAATLKNVLDTHKIESFDLLQVDTEGYDSEIIHMLLETEFRPSIISFEHGMPQSIMTPKVFWDLGELLMENGYYISTQEYDAIAYRLTPDMNVWAHRS